MNPKQRQDDLVIQPMESELLIYDQATCRAYSLNESVAQVYKQCDGKTSIEQIVQHVMQLRAISIEEAEAIVDLALEQLSQRGLLEQSIQRTPQVQRLSRREMILKLAKASVMVPVIVAMTAPSPIEAFQTFGRSSGSPCEFDFECLSCICVGAQPPTTTNPTGTPGTCA